MQQQCEKYEFDIFHVKLGKPIFRKQEKVMIGSIHKAALPFNLFIDVLNMEKIQSIQTQSKHVHHFKYSTKDILFQKCCEPSQTIQLQINNHSHIKNWDKRGGRQHFFHAWPSAQFIKTKWSWRSYKKKSYFQQWQIRHENCGLHPTAASITTHLDLNVTFTSNTKKE